MNTTVNPKERFRKGFVLVMTLACRCSSDAIKPDGY
jgi:hypothetical protein